MTEVVVKRKTSSPLYHAFVNGKKLKFADDEACTKVAPGDHVLTWVVMGAPGSSYSIEIAKPKEARFSHEATFDEAGKDAGLHWFKVSALLLLLASPGWAQRPTASGMRHVADPSLASAIALPAPTLILEGTTSGKNATARFGVQWGDVLADAKLSGPIDGNGVARPASLEGLGSSASLELGLTLMRWNPVADPAAMQRVCDAFTEQTGTRVERCVRSSLPGDWRRRHDEAVDYGTPFFLSLRGRIGRKSFSFADSTTLARTTVRKTPSSAAVSVGLYRASLGFLSASWMYETAYTGAEAVQVCRPLPTPGTLACGDERLHGPDRDASSLARLEFRRIFGSGFGVRAVATRRFASDIWGFELPLYFLRDGKGLTGGLSAGWRSDTRDVTVAFFVGEVLGLVP